MFSAASAQCQLINLRGIKYRRKCEGATGLFGVHDSQFAEDGRLLITHGTWAEKLISMNIGDITKWNAVLLYIFIEISMLSTAERVRVRLDFSKFTILRADVEKALNLQEILVKSRLQ